MKKGAKNPFRIINRALHNARVKNLGVSSCDWGVISEDGRWRMTGDCACPLGLCLAGTKVRKGDDQSIAATRVLGQKSAWVTAFINAVDGGKSQAHYPKQAYSFGKRIRAKYVQQ